MHKALGLIPLHHKFKILVKGYKISVKRPVVVLLVVVNNNVLYS
jgi:hypothetical protein